MTARRPDSLDDLRVGDEVAIIKRYYGTTTATIERVSRATKAQIMVMIPNMLGERHEWKFRRKDGWEVGGGNITSTWWRVELLNEKTRAMVAETIEDAEDDRIRRLINKAKLTRKQLRRIRAILDEEPPE